jgi:hypothetical protein
MSRRLKPKNEKRVLAAGFVLPKIKRVIEEKATKEQRSESSIVALLLESHPEVKRLLRAA